MSLEIKICGLSTPAALDAALDAGADFVGFVFFPPSPRHLSFEAARALGERARGRARKVALSVEADDEWLAASIEALKPDLLQLHGKETPERVLAVRNKFHLPVMKAVPVQTASDLDAIPPYVKVADRILIDARAPKDATRPGGIGQLFDWGLLLRDIHPPARQRSNKAGWGVEQDDSRSNLRRGVGWGAWREPGDITYSLRQDSPHAIPFMLSGGLGLDNIKQALLITKAPAVDVSSGVERAPGDKDPDKIRAFIRAARAAAADAGKVASSA